MPGVMKKADRIKALRKSLSATKVKQAEKLSADDPDVATLAGLLVKPVKEVELSKYDKSMMKALGVSKQDYLAAKQIR